MDPVQPPLRWWGHAWRMLVMISLSAVAWLPAAEQQADRAAWLPVLDVALGLVAYVLVHLRRRRPLAAAVVVTVLSAFSGVAAGPALLAAASLATHRRWRQVALVGVLGVASGQLFSLMNPAAPAEPLWLLLAVNVVGTAAVLGWGLYIGSRRELLWTLRQRAVRAEAEQELRASQARTTERTRIAREMHDVLAHRISQVAMHAGALGYRDDLSAAELREGVQQIQQRAHEALRDLRGVLGVLRESEPGAPGETRPQPTWADLPALVDEARSAGLHVTLDDDLAAAPGSEPVPDGVGRTVYRIVQEGMTNVHKHAPGAVLRIRLSGGPGEGVRVHLDNPLGFGSGTPGSGLGLVGLRERAELLGGCLEHRRERDTFIVESWLPWEAA